MVRLLRCAGPSDGLSFRDLPLKGPAAVQPAGRLCIVKTAGRLGGRRSPGIEGSAGTPWKTNRPTSAGNSTGSLQEWSARTALLGAGIFLCLSLLDFSCVPDHAVRFLGYRIAVAAFLAATAVAMRRAQRRAEMHLLDLPRRAGLGSRPGGDDPGLRRPPLPVPDRPDPAGRRGVGPDPLGRGVRGPERRAPSSSSTSCRSCSGTPSRDPAFFTVNTVLFFCVLAAGVLVRWFHQRHLVGQISLRHDLIQSRERPRARDRAARTVRHRAAREPGVALLHHGRGHGRHRDDRSRGDHPLLEPGGDEHLRLHRGGGRRAQSLYLPDRSRRKPARCRPIIAPGKPRAPAPW